MTLPRPIIGYNRALDLVVLAGGGLLLAAVAAWGCFWRGRGRLHRRGAQALMVALTAAALMVIAEGAWRASARGSLWLAPLAEAARFHYWLRYGLVAATVVAWGVATAALLHRFPAPGRHPRLRKALRGSATVLFSALVCALGAEVYFKVFFVASSGNDLMLASRAWHARYWKPLNRDGFRDLEWPMSQAELRARRLVVVVGDSVAAGAGLEDLADRFSSRLRLRLGPGWHVITLAKPGWNTGEELSALEHLPLKPEVLVWSYVFNDIDDLAAPMGIRRQTIEPPGEPWATIVQDSHLINFLYWRVRALREGAGLQVNQRNYLALVYHVRRIWSAQEERLARVIDYAERQEARLVVVVFPDLGDLAATAPILAPVTRFFRERGVPVVDIGEVTAGEDPRTLVVSGLDSHPKAALHDRVAEIVYRELLRSTATAPVTRQGATALQETTAKPSGSAAGRSAGASGISGAPR